MHSKHYYGDKYYMAKFCRSLHVNTVLKCILINPQADQP